MTNTSIDAVLNPHLVVSEPYVYSLLLVCPRGSLLHQGIYYALDDAYHEGRKQLMRVYTDVPLDLVDMSMWVRERVSVFFKKAVAMQGATQSMTDLSLGVSQVAGKIDELKEAKNAILQSLIKSGDKTLVQQAEHDTIITRSEAEYVLSSIGTQKMYGDKTKSVPTRSKKRKP